MNKGIANLKRLRNTALENDKTTLRVGNRPLHFSSVFVNFLNIINYLILNKVFENLVGHNQQAVLFDIMLTKSQTAASKQHYFIQCSGCINMFLSFRLYINSCQTQDLCWK